MLVIMQHRLYTVEIDLELFHYIILDLVLNDVQMNRFFLLSRIEFSSVNDIVVLELVLEIEIEVRTSEVPLPVAQLLLVHCTNYQIELELELFPTCTDCRFIGVTTILVIYDFMIHDDETTMLFLLL